ncbi:Heavy metal transport/detoxification superfamily protein [Rhynchospora pubera]|nr:Heavy metal transport/detoxification superfamily protein [Rhynchospora pubera]
MKTVSNLYGVDSISVDMKDKKLTVIGFVDPVDMVSKLRKQWHTEIFSVGPAKEPEKKKEEEKKGGDKRNDPKKGDKKDANKQVAELVGTYKPYNPNMAPVYYGRRRVEDNPNACVIC